MKAGTAWRCVVRVALAGGERWERSAPLSYKRARALAEHHARSGRRARIEDPEGRQTRDLPRSVEAPQQLRLAMQ